jgi:HEAT repeats
MGAYARKEGLAPVANFAMLTQARLWQDVASLSRKRGAPAEIAENALLAAVMACGEAGQYEKVGGLYGALSELPLEDGRRKHYAKAKTRYRGAQDLKIDAGPLPAHLRYDVGFPEVWHVDLVEWEQHGSAGQACGDVILETGLSDMTRRRAVLARLTALGIEQLEQAATPNQSALRDAYVALAEQLMHIELYSILSPLEHMYRRPEQRIRLAVVRALSRFLFKRTFITLREALLDPEPTIVSESARSIEELRFPHAFDPLARIYRESQNATVRASAVRALAKIDTLEAAEMLLGVIEHDGSEERIAAVEALKRTRGSKFPDLAKSSFSRLASSAQAAVREVLEARGALA